MAFAGRRTFGGGEEEPTATPDATAPDPFALLGVPPTASAREITEAYRSLARQHHPDRHQKSSTRRRREAERRMQELNEAYREARTRRRAPTPQTYQGTSVVPNAALWLGTAPGTWARTARRSGSGGPVTEEERRLSREQIAQAASEHEARARVARETRLHAEQQAGTGQARSQPKPRASNGSQQRSLSGLGQALATDELRCKRCRSLQRLPLGWQQRLPDTDFFCSGCGEVLLSR